MGEPATKLPTALAPAQREAAKRTVQLIVIEGGKRTSAQAATTAARQGMLSLLGRAAGQVVGKVFGVAGMLLYPSKLGDGTLPEEYHRFEAIPDFHPDIVQECPECDEDDKDCIVGPYNEIKNKCPGSQAHHIVPDYTLRYGTRMEAIRNQKRIPNMPSFGDGPAICLEGHAAIEGTEHNRAHQVDHVISELGRYQQVIYPEAPSETAPVGKIVTASALSVAAVKPECASEIATSVARAFPPSTHGQLGRSRKDVLPQGETLDALEHGRRLSDYYPHLGGTAQ